jgi:hypothetical protein
MFVEFRKLAVVLNMSAAPSVAPPFVLSMNSSAVQVALAVP